MSVRERNNLGLNIPTRTHLKFKETGVKIVFGQRKSTMKPRFGVILDECCRNIGSLSVVFSTRLDSVQKEVNRMTGLSGKCN